MSIGSEVSKFRKRRAGEIDDVVKQTDFLTLMIGDQMFGIPVLQVQDVLRQQRVTRVPLAPPEVAGAMNLRGRIVTAIDVRCRLAMKKIEDGASTMSVVVEHDGELYSLIIDRVGDVLRLTDDEFESAPATLDATWRDVSSGIFRLKERLLVIIDIAKLLQTETIH